MMDTNVRVAPAVASILESARERAGGDRVDVDARSLSSALAKTAADGRVPLIAEVKPTSPTTDGERRVDPVVAAREMVAGGATALSVLTEPEHFDGSPDALRRVREAVDVPVLRKDFLLREAHLDVVAADAVLLIARFLPPGGAGRDDADDLETMIAAARDRGFQPLVEAHTREEVERAVAAGAEVLGVNNRDLARLEVDLDTFEEVAPAAPEDVTLLAESGITTRDDVRRMRDTGADGLLVGSAIMDGDVRENTRRFVTAGEGDE
jgi:indole-3-glycerol phosphate synthase